jgi:hypothetical protein
MAERGTLLLAIGYLSGLGLLGYLLRDAPPAPSDPTETVGVAVPPLELPQSTISTLAAYDAIVERPLFDPARRPGVAAEIAASPDDEGADAVEEVDGFRLAAVLKGLGSTTALIEDELGTTQILRPGERLADWVLAEILDDRVVLTADGRRETLRVYQFDKAAVRPRVARRPAPGRRLVRPPVQRVPVAGLPQDPEQAEDAD